MPRSSITLSLSDAKRMLIAGEAKAASFGVAYNIAVVDAGGALVAFSRQDGALIGSIELAIGKAVTARIFDKRTADLATMAQPGAPLYGIQQTNDGKGRDCQRNEVKRIPDRLDEYSVVEKADIVRHANEAAYREGICLVQADPDAPEQWDDK